MATVRAKHGNQNQGDPVYREAVKRRQAAVKDSRLIRLQPLAPDKTFGEIPEP